MRRGQGPGYPEGGRPGPLGQGSARLSRLQGRKQTRKARKVMEKVMVRLRSLCLVLADMLNSAATSVVPWPAAATIDRPGEDVEGGGETCVPDPQVDGRVGEEDGDAGEADEHGDDDGQEGGAVLLQELAGE